MPDSTPYDEGFFKHNLNGAIESARVVVPRVLEIVPARSVVDVGCGTGSWLSVFLENGVNQVRGVDGDYVNRANLLIPADRFTPADLSKPLHLPGESFDLAVSLEVGEHLPDSSARGFVESICRLAPAVLFSAALPGQHGVDHINEQWPEYWRRLYAGFGYRMYDAFRPGILHDRRVEVWYRTNIFLAVKAELAASNPRFASIPELTADTDVMLLPRTFTDGHGGLGYTFRMLPRMIGKSVAYRLGRRPK